MDQQSPTSQNLYALPGIPLDQERSPSPNKPNEPLIQPIHIAGSLSLDDFYFARRLSKPRPKRRVLYFVAILLLIFVICNCYPGMIKSDIGMAIYTFVCVMFFATIFVLVFGGLSVWSYHAWQDWKLRNIHAARIGIFAQTDTLISEDGYEATADGIASKVPWSIFAKFRHSDRIVLLYYNKALLGFSIIARSKFQSQHDWNCFLGLLDRKLPRC